MATQRPIHQGVDPPRGLTETPLSPAAAILPSHGIDGRTVNTAGAPFHLQGHQTRANTSPWVSGLPRHFSYHSNFASNQPHDQYHAPLNDQWRSQQRTAWQPFNAVPPPHLQSSFHPMSSTTTTVRANANHAFAGTQMEVRPGGRAEPPALTTPQDPPTYTAISITADGKRYLCQCGHSTKTIGDMDRHHESLKHSERMHVCGCGKKYSRKDGLARHEKKCAVNAQTI